MTFVTVDPSYTYPPEACDVHDQKKLAEYRLKRTEWVGLLDRNQPHSVGGQLYSLVWRDAVFRLFNEVWRRRDERKPTASMNPLIAGALQQGYVAEFVLGVSRLTDPMTATKAGDRNVVSLRRVFEDIRKHRALLTREIFVCYDGLPYDIDSIPPHPERPREGGGAVQIGGPTDDISMDQHHEQFDRLSGVAKENRTRDDLIAVSTFDDIETLLSLPVFEKLRTLRNKVIAHAADPASLGSLTSFGFTLDEAEAALKALTQAYRHVRSDLLWHAIGGVMPVPQFDIFEHMDQPFLRPDQIEALGTFWDQLVEERDEWRRGATTTKRSTGQGVSISDQIDRMLS